MNSARTITASLLLALGTAIPVRAAGGGAMLDDSKAAPIKTALQKAIKGGNTPGAVFWLERGGESIQFALGDRAIKPKREPMTGDTIFDAASLTKPIATATSILILADQGKLRLDATARSFIPEFKGEGRETITIRQLLAHVSGLPPSLPKDPPWNGYEAGIALACQAVPATPPGTSFRYSDINFILLGEIVRRAGEMPLDAFARKHIFAPLQMTSTGFRPGPDVVAHTAPTEKDEAGAMLRGVVHDPAARRMGGVAGHAGLFTCADDLARFARMMLNGGELEGARILKPETVKLMTSVQSPPTVVERRGLGWDIDSNYSRPRGATPDAAAEGASASGFPLGSFGHTGFTGTALWIDPFSGTFYILLTSRLHPDGRGEVRELYSEVGALAAKCVSGFDLKNVAGSLSPRLKSGEVPTVLNGIDVLQRKDFAPLSGLRVGLITNQTGRNRSGESSIDLLARASGVKLGALFSPEHGIRGELDQAKISDTKDEKTGLPIFSLYGERKTPTAEQLKDLDALVFDIQDIGCRFYTYISTMQLCMEAAARSGKKFIVLDRVNPIGGAKMEGPVRPDAESFVACHPMPLRHGMTVGELAQLMNFQRGIEADLTVIPCEGWSRALWLDQTGLPWINPSPNMRGLAAATLYPGVGLLESAVSVGRGTDRPFEYVGAPYVDELRLAHAMNAEALPGVRFVPIRFTPAASVFKDKPCGGVEILITQRDTLNAVDVGIALACVLQRLYPKEFALGEMQRLLLDEKVLEAIRAGESWKDIKALWNAHLQVFRNRRAAFLLYP